MSLLKSCLLTLVFTKLFIEFITGDDQCTVVCTKKASKSKATGFIPDGTPCLDGSTGMWNGRCVAGRCITE